MNSYLFMICAVLVIGQITFNMPQPPLNYLMPDWQINAPGAPPGKAILYYDIPMISGKHRYFDKIPDLVIAYTIEKFVKERCPPQSNLMTRANIILGTACDSKNPVVYYLKRPYFAVREYMQCESKNPRMCLGWRFASEGN